MNFANLNDVEFEYLCKDIMSKKLGVELRRFAQGRDGGVDLTDSLSEKNIVVQVKHYIKTDFSGLLSSLKEELLKVKKINPKQYYVCCSKELTPKNIEKIYSVFHEYMQSDKNIISLIDINDFLQCEENAEILHKHFKLWIDSTNILQDVLTNNVSIDCESLLYNIDNEEKLFVNTSVFEKAKSILEKKRLLLIVGDPGVGKTITSKMLLLHFATQGYRIRYTTDGNNLGDLKKALSNSIETKEIILLDDCFGQAYYDMKYSQTSELISVIRHVQCYTNKILIINSRITIYNEAKKSSIDLLKSIESKEFEIAMINMNDMSQLEKAKILYNHLYFSKLPNEYFEKIKENKFYWKIINHANYNPRIVEHFTANYNCETIDVEKYPQYILGCLSNPKEIWKSEFEDRLKPCDRFLVYAVYSLTNTSIPLEIVRECFYRIISDEPEIDSSVNNFEASFARLQSSFFLKMIDKDGNIEISMLNPSINDFLDSYTSKDMIKKIISKALSIRQFYRLNPKNTQSLILNAFRDKSILDFCFESDKQKNAFITAVVVKNGILDKEFCQTIYSFIADAADADLYNKQKIYKSTILQGLISEPLCSYYNISVALQKEGQLARIFEQLEFPDLVSFISGINSLITQERSNFISLCKESMKEALEFYCLDVPANEYDIDVGQVAREIGYKGEFEFYCDPQAISEAIESEVQSIVKSEVSEYLSVLPSELIPEDIRNDKYSVSVSGALEMVEFDEAYYYDDDEVYHDRHEENGDSEIDYIFQR